MLWFGGGGESWLKMVSKSVVISGGLKNPLVSTNLPTPTNTCMSQPMRSFSSSTPKCALAKKVCGIDKVTHTSRVRRSLLLVRTAVFNGVEKRHWPTFLPLIDPPEESVILPQSPVGW